MEAVNETENPDTTFSLSHVVRLVTLTLIGVGLVFRARGFLVGTIPLWEDEAAWAMRLVDLPLSAHGIRPLGFMAISKLLVTLFSPSELVLRALPWLSGVGALLLAPSLAKRLFTSVAPQLLFVAVIALHPAAIDMSKEFKPYSLSLALHMALLLLGLRYLSERKVRDLALLLGLLFLGTLFSQDVVFTYPGLFGVLLFDAYRARRPRRMLAVGLAGAATLGLLITFYVCWWKKTVEPGTTRYWGNKYDVFYVKARNHDHSRLSWTTARVADLAALPGLRRQDWKAHRLSQATLEEMKAVDTSVWQLLGLLGAATLFFRQRERDQLLLLAPLGVLLVFNRLGFWPLGAFRTNLFAVVYVAAIAGKAIDRRSSKVEGWDFVPAGALVIVPFLLLGKTTHTTKSATAADSAFPDAVRALASLRKADGNSRAQLALDGASCAPWRYYMGYHPDRARMQELAPHLRVHCTKNFNGLTSALRQGLRTTESRSYALLGDERSMRELKTKLPSDLALDGQMWAGKRNELVVRIKRR